ncbi:MAG: hypothetical protein ABFS32_20155 [Bacteroidota bacterium]
MHKLYLIIIILFSSGISHAQNPQGRQGRQGNMRDPAQIANLEKQMILDSITTLNEDQKLIINHIYNDFGEAIKKARTGMEPGNPEGMRDKMMKVREQKDDALKAILTEEQYKKYERIMRARMQQGRKRRNK